MSGGPRPPGSPAPAGETARLRELLALALRATSGRHAEAARNVVLTILLAQLLADAGHAERPGPAPRPSRRRAKAPRAHHGHRSALSGRRPRG